MNAKVSGIGLGLQLATLGAMLLAGCVPAQQYNSLQAQYDQLRSAYSSDQADITLLQGKPKVTMRDEILFPEGGYTITPRSEAVLVSAQGHGDADAVAANATAEGRAKYRRIEVTLVGPGT